MAQKHVLLALACIGLGACSHVGENLVGGHCDSPPFFLFQLADRNGQVLTTSATDQLTASFADAGNVAQPIGPYTPLQLAGAAAASPWFYSDGVMIGKSLQGYRTFYLTYKGKTDTLRLEPLDDCGYQPSVQFNGQAVAEMPSITSTPGYFVLRRQH